MLQDLGGTGFRMARAVFGAIQLWAFVLVLLAPAPSRGDSRWGLCRSLGSAEAGRWG